MTNSIKNISWKTLIGFASIVALSGCSKNLDCASKEAQDLVEQIATANPPSYLLLYPALGGVDVHTEYSKIRYAIDAVRTTDKNSATGAVSCAASLHVREPHVQGANLFNPDHTATLDITYTLEVTSDNKLYATVFGLR
jgi:hypothetical protein